MLYVYKVWGLERLYELKAVLFVVKLLFKKEKIVLIRTDVLARASCIDSNIRCVYGESFRERTLRTLSFRFIFDFLVLQVFYFFFLEK